MSANRPQVLLGYDAEVDARTEQGKTPLVMAVGKGASVEVLTALIEAGADPNAKSDIITPLGSAVLHRQVDTIRYLLSVGADPHALVGADGRHIVDVASDPYRHNPEIEAMIREAIA